MGGRMDHMRGGAERLQRRSLSQINRVAAEAQAGHVDTVRWLRLGEIVELDDIQVRVGGVNAAAVHQYAVVMYESHGWGDFPPVDVHHDRAHGWLLSAGYHRVAAARLASQWLLDEGAEPIDDVPVVERPDGLVAALEYAEQDNLRHGEALSTADKRNIFERRLARGHAWAQLSDRAIARELGVDNKTVCNWRRDFFARVENSTPEQTTRIGADGKAYDVSGIQAASRQRAAPSRAPGVAHATPEEPVVQFADLARADDQTVGEQVPVLAALLDFIGAAIDLARKLENIQRGGAVVPEELKAGFRDLVLEALDHCNGYESLKNRWVSGVVDLLEGVLEDIG